LHELAHIALRQEGLCDLDDLSPRDSEALAIERFCNRAAAAALVPETALQATGIVRRHDTGAAWSNAELGGLVRAFNVSWEVMLRRLLDLRLTDWDRFNARLAEVLEGYEEARSQRQEGFAPPHQIALATAGPTFTGLVLSGYADRQITASDVSDYLGIRLKHLPRIEAQILRSRRSS
jgi:hypothetical protein